MIDYSRKLSEHFTIGDLSKNAFFPHEIVAQRGLTEEEIIKNLEQLCVEILEPLYEKFPGFIITSGFRKGSAKSQHNIGQAVDIQWPKRKGKEYLEILFWIRDTLNFDQLISEHGRSVWIHASHDPGKEPQRKMTMTYHPSHKPQYTPGLKVYY